MIAKIIAFCVENAAAIGSILSLLAGFIVAWKRGTKKGQDAQAAKDIAVNIVKATIEPDQTQAEKYVDQQIAARRQADKQVGSQYRRGLVRDWRKWWGEAKKRIGKG